MRGTDQHVLQTKAYADDSDLRRRQGIYAHQEPKIDFPGWALDHVAWRGDEVVVDVGCGNGIYHDALGGAAARCRSLCALDLSFGMVSALAPQPGIAFQPVCGDGAALPLREGSADVVLAMHVLYHVPSIAAAVEELARVCRFGGTVVISANGAEDRRELVDVFSAALLVAGVDPSTSQRTSERFSLETGDDVVRRRFPESTVHAVDSVLVVSDAATVIDYVDTWRPFEEPQLPPGAWPVILAEVGRLVSDEIADHGAFHIQKRAGIWKCSRR